MNLYARCHFKTGDESDFDFKVVPFLLVCLFEKYDSEKSRNIISKEDCGHKRPTNIEEEQDGGSRSSKKGNVLPPFGIDHRFTYQQDLK